MNAPMQKAEGSLAKQPVKRKVTFRVKMEPGRRVFVAGTFNDWNPDRHAMKEGGDEYRLESGTGKGAAAAGIHCVGGKGWPRGSPME